MKIGYFEVHNGCAGDMLAASLIDAGLSRAALSRELGKLGLRNYTLRIETVSRPTGYGHPLKAALFNVVPRAGRWDDHTAYRTIVRIVQKSRLAKPLREKIQNIFSVLAEAEALVHGEKPECVHFHEVGQIDAIVETAAVVIGLDLLGVEEISCGAVGLAQPAPATARIVRGMKTVPRDVPYEITTPTGAAILKGLCGLRGPARPMTFSTVGFGAGTRPEPSPNVVRFYLGETGGTDDTVVVIETNIDDMNPVLFEHAMERLYAAGALDVCLTMGQGKKNRPVFQLMVLGSEAGFDRLAHTIFEETTTLGLRYRIENRRTLERLFRDVKTPWGAVPVKVGLLEGKQVNVSPEYEPCRRIAAKHGVPLKAVYDQVRRGIKDDRRSV